MNGKRSTRARPDPSSANVRKQVVIGLVVLMVLVAGCGDNTDSGTTTAGEITTNNRSTIAVITQSGPPTSTYAGTTARPRTEVPASTVASSMTRTNTTADGAGLDVAVKPATSNTTNATLIVHATMTDASASDGIENVSIDTGGGLDLGNVSVANVNTVGIDEGGRLPGDRTETSLVTHVERTIELTDNGTVLTIPLDGNQSVEPGDELVAVVDGGIETNRAGRYTFTLTVGDGPSQTDDYTLS